MRKMAEAMQSNWETTCLDLRTRVSRCCALQRKCRGALLCLLYAHPDMSAEESVRLQGLLTALASQLAKVQTVPQPPKDGVDDVLQQRVRALGATLCKMRLAALYLAHQLVNVALQTLAAMKPPCFESLAVGVCVLARELQNCTVENSNGVGSRLLLYRNTCPLLLVPSRRLTLTRLLQIAAAHRAEAASRTLLSALLCKAPTTLSRGCSEDRDFEEKIASSSDEDKAEESGSSLEVARELIRFASPSAQAPPLGACVASEQALPSCLVAAARAHAPLLAGPSGATLLGQRDARVKVLTYYRQLVWGGAGALADHVLLWWLRPIDGLWSGHSILQWLRRLQRAEVGCAADTAMGSSVGVLCEALAAHHAAITWDANFRRTLVTPSGSRFAALFSTLVEQVNSAESAVEQIPLLHRLDHSLHTYRLWVLAAARQNIGAWRVRNFVDISQRDVANAVLILGHHKISQLYEESPPLECVHETVCAKMRCKLVSEVKENLIKLQRAPEECIEVMAAACRTVSLATLLMVFPPPRYWRQDGPVPQFASAYVETYLERVLRPVLTALVERPVEAQQLVGGMALRILCEAWLDHIYKLRVHFSEWGALQLLADFGAVPTWLQERASLSPAVEKSLVRSEVLRRCEGVGRLLLRRPGEALDLQKGGKHDKPVANSSSSPPTTPVKDSMPAEMYVPNQEKWLELRARRRTGTASGAVAAAFLCCR